MSALEEGKMKNIKDLCSHMKKKTEFVELVASHYSKGYRYILQNWFQSKWNIPEDNLDNILRMAQNYLFSQSEKDREALKESGYEIPQQEL